MSVAILRYDPTPLPHPKFLTPSSLTCTYGTLSRIDHVHTFHTRRPTYPIVAYTTHELTAYDFERLTAVSYLFSFAIMIGTTVLRV